MFDTPRSHARAVWTAVWVTMLWSSSWVLIRVGLDDESLPPITFAGLRYTLAAAVLLVWVLARPRSRAELTGLGLMAWRRLVVLGVLLYGVTQGAQFVAIDAQPAATSSLMLAPTPLLVAVLSQRSIGEAVHPRQVLGAALIGAGAVTFFGGDLGATAIGMTASIVGLSANVASALLGRSINRQRHLSAIAVTAVSMTIGAIILLVAGLTIEPIPRLSWTAIVVIAWLALINTAWAFTMWNTALRRLSAVESAAINNTMLIQIAVLAWVFLDEPPGLLGASGIAIVFGGSLLARGSRLTPAPRR